MMPVITISDLKNAMNENDESYVRENKIFKLKTIILMTLLRKIDGTWMISSKTLTLMMTEHLTVLYIIWLGKQKKNKYFFVILPTYIYLLIRLMSFLFILKQSYKMLL